MLIDAHVHIFPNVNGYNGNGFVRSVALGKVQLGTGKIIQFLPPSFQDVAFVPEVLLSYMEWLGIDHVVIMQGPFYGDLNDYVYEAVKKWPLRFTGAAMIDPYLKNTDQILRRLLHDMGFRILKLECSEQFGLSGFHPGLNYLDEPFSRVWKTANDLGLTVVVDTGPVLSAGCQLEALDRVARQYPDMRLVLPHLCFPPGKNERIQIESQWRACISLGKLPNVWFDISSLVGIEGDEYPFPLAQEYIRLAYEEVGAGKLIFGTDVPGIFTKCTYDQAISFVRDHCTFFSSDHLSQVLYKNAIEVYGIRCMEELS